MANIFQIKRRKTGAAGAPTEIANGELAYNEIDNILYYGGDSNASVKIGGTGAFATVDTVQDISGAKTFTGNVQLSGAVTAPTIADIADSSTNVATTAFVTALAASLNGGDF